MASSSLDSSPYDTAAFDRGTGPVIRLLSPDQARRVLEYRGDDALRLRIEELATKNSEGALTSSEKAEYEGYVRANKFVAILQAQAQKLLDSRQSDD